MQDRSSETGLLNTKRYAQTSCSVQLVRYVLQGKLDDRTGREPTDQTVPGNVARQKADVDAVLNDLAGRHLGHLVADMRDHRQIV